MRCLQLGAHLILVSLFLRRSALLASGDAAALLLFAAIGRSNHSEGLAPAAVLATAAPFLLGVPKILALALSKCGQSVVVKVC